MGITAKDVQMYLMIFLEFSMRLCCNFVRENPLPSFVFLVFIVLYLFLSSVFWFLIYSLPLLLIASIIIKVIYFPETCKNVGIDNKGGNVDPKSPSIACVIRFAEGEEKKKKSMGRAQSVRRRKSKKDFPPYVQEDNGSILPPIGFSEHHVFDKSALTEENNMKDIREVEVEVHPVSDHPPECSSSDASQNLGLTKSWRKVFRSIDKSDTETTDDSENEKGGIQSRNKGVMDQKNLMDLSEMERNKRLESLMARRRARRLVSLHVRRTLMNLGSEDPPISMVIPKPNSGSTGQFSPTPGSAPSVLLPNHNPFDLPYDQHEEKPNLRGGSFHQDFMVPNQDMMFCRHESFSLGSSYTGDFNSDLPPRRKVFESSQNYRSRTLFGKENVDRVIEQVSVQEPKVLNQVITSEDKEQDSGVHEEDGSEVQIKSVLIEDIDDRTSSSSSSEEEEPFYKIDKDAILKSLSTPSAQRNHENGEVDELLNPGSSMSQKERMEEHFYYANDAMLPTPSHSIASDLQVEVSEVSSPPSSVDGTSSLEEEILAYNRKMEKDTNSGLSISILDVNIPRSMEVLEVTDEDFVKVGFLTVNTPPERVIQQYSVDSNPFAPERARSIEENSASIDENDILELIKRNSHGKHGAELAISEEHVIQEARVASYSLPSSPITVSQSEFLTDRDCFSNLDVEVQEVNGHKVENDTSNSTIPPITDLLLDDPMDHSFPPLETDKNEENSTLQIPEFVGEQVPDVPSSSMSPKSQSEFSLNQDSSSNFASEIYTEDREYGFAKRHSEDYMGSSMFNQSSNDPEYVVGEISTSSSSSSSPRSVSRTKLSIDLGSSNLDQELQMEASSSTSSLPKSISQTKLSMDLGSSNLDQEIQMEDRHFQNQITEQSTDDFSNGETESPSKFETTSQHSESYDHEKSPEETSTSNHTNEAVIPEEKLKEIQNRDFIKETEGELLHSDAGRGPQSPSISENDGAKMTAEVKPDINELSNLNVSKEQEEKNDSTHSEGTPDLPKKPLEEDERNDKTPNFQGSHEGEPKGLPSHDSVNEPSQVSQSVSPRKVEDEHWIQNEVDSAISSSEEAVVIMT